MTQTTNAHLVSAITPFASGAVYVDRQVTDIANRNIFPVAIANADQIQIGIVPAGTVLIPHLTLIRIPQLDTNGAATGKYKIGTAASIAAVAAEQNGGAASTLFGKDLVLTGVVGDNEVDTPIFLTASAAVATLATLGTITLDLALRAFRSDVDGV